MVGIMRVEIRQWWEQAKRDMLSASHALDARDYYLAVFLCHQGVEKGLRALVMNKDRTREVVSHSLIFLAGKAGVPERFLPFLRELTPQYILTRYPSAGLAAPYELFDRQQASGFLKKSREVLEWTGKQLK